MEMNHEGPHVSRNNLSAKRYSPHQVPATVKINGAMVLSLDPWTSSGIDLLNGSLGLVINWPGWGLVDLLVCPASPARSGLGGGRAGSCGGRRWVSGAESVVP